MNFRNSNSTLSKMGLLVTVCVTGASCTGQITGSIRLAQRNEVFSSQQQANTKIDMLWVVDNSASMDVSQKNLRNGFTSFAAKYMKPTWDIRVAAITTDAYLAHPAFSGYLASTYFPSGYHSTYLGNQVSNPPGGTETPVQPLGTAFINPSYPNWVAGTINSSGNFTRNASINQIYPSYGSNWAMLLPGLHDGPLASLCAEGATYFFFGESQCFIRDKSANRGPDHCINPTGTEDSVTQCVNTFMNDTIHSNLPIVSTIPPTGTPADATWTNALVRNFMMNISTGSNGSGSERGMSSVLQMIKDNEDSTTRKANANPLFRPGSLRVIVFVSDEDDQSISLDANDPLDPAPITPTDPFTGYVSAQLTCPVAPGSPQTANCCATKTVDGYTYTIPICPKGYPAATAPTAGAVLMPTSHIKTKFDNFFQRLDGLSAGPSSSYMVAAIVLTNGQSIQTIREIKRCDEENLIFGHCDLLRSPTSDRGDRYIELVNLVRNGSLALDLASTDYTPILDSIGQAILANKNTYTLSRLPTSTEQMTVTIIHADGTTTVIPSTAYSISGYNLIITDNTIILSLAATDLIQINYQPRSLY